MWTPCVLHWHPDECCVALTGCAVGHLHPCGAPARDTRWRNQEHVKRHNSLSKSLTRPPFTRQTVWRETTPIAQLPHVKLHHNTCRRNDPNTMAFSFTYVDLLGEPSNICSTFLSVCVNTHGSHGVHIRCHFCFGGIVCLWVCPCLQFNSVYRTWTV